jgi:hypothetical protein
MTRSSYNDLLLTCIGIDEVTRQYRRWLACVQTYLFIERSDFSKANSPAGIILRLNSYERHHPRSTIRRLTCRQLTPIGIALYRC